MLAYHKINPINAQVGIYLRVSLEDGDRQESNSINNQRKLIYEYLKQNNFKHYSEFIDDGATGTNFEREGFKKLLEEIESGNINTVITKDVSRIGRNYVKTGFYLEDYFVSKGVRYISVLDAIDTYSEVIGNELLPFRAILNDMYSKDISLKQKSSLMERKKRGKYIACYAPYGYKKNDKMVGKLNIDEEAAKIVKRIFVLFLQGNGTTAIARLLTEEKIPTPAMHLNMNTDKDSMLYAIWKPNTIKRILRNKTYLGYMIQNKEKTLSHKNHTRVILQEKDYIVIPNHHLPIIKKEDFEKVNEMLDSKKRALGKQKEQTILHELIYCEECGKRLARKDIEGKIYYYCPTRTVFHLCNNKNYLPYDSIEKNIFKYLAKYLKKYSNRKVLEKKYIEEYAKNKTRMEEYKNAFAKYSKELTKINNKLDILYYDKLNHVISSNMYKKYASTQKEERKQLEEKINTINKLMKQEKELISELKCNKKSVEKCIDKFYDLDHVNTATIKELVEKISIGKNRDFHIKFKFNSCY